MSAVSGVYHVKAKRAHAGRRLCSWTAASFVIGLAAGVAHAGTPGRRAQDAAEAGVGIVRTWFDDPAHATVPDLDQMDRTRRWVDDDGDGTYGPFDSAAVPYDVIYRQGTDDPFEKPYEGSPAQTLIGIEDHPDVRISETGTSGEQAYLAALNERLFSPRTAGGRQTRIVQIDLYAPPIRGGPGQRRRDGIATIKVRAGVFSDSGTRRERRIASRTARAILHELPIPGNLGPLHARGVMYLNGVFNVHWGTVTTGRDLDLNSNLDGKVDSSVPWYNIDRIIALDMNLDGYLQTSPIFYTPDDMDHDGTLDFLDWLSGPDVEDPWLRFLAAGEILANGGGIAPGCVSPNCQPVPWFQWGTFGSGNTDHSNLFKNVTRETFPEFDYGQWKSIARSGGPNVYYYASDGPGTGTYKLDGVGTSVTVKEATDGRDGLFFFDTANNRAPIDADGDGSFDNLADLVVLSDETWTTGGLLYLNADLSTSGNGTAASLRTVAAPAEPFIDANLNGRYDPDEWFVELTYPLASTGTYVKTGQRRAMDGFTRKVPANDATVSGRYDLGVNVYGIVFTSGRCDLRGNWTFYGSVIARQGVWAQGNTGTPHVYFDGRLAEKQWPPSGMSIPRTFLKRLPDVQAP